MPRLLGNFSGMPGSTASTDLAKLARLHAGLLELVSVIATADRSELLDAIARTVSEALGWDTVVMNVYRPAWDDYEVQAVHGDAAVRDALLGEATPWSTWAPLISDRFAHRGAYLVRHGEFDWEADPGVSYRHERPAFPGAEAWDSDDALFVPLHAKDGSVSGILSVDDPTSRRLPTDDEIDALVAISKYAEVALHQAQETTDLRSHRATLKHFHEVFSRNRHSAPVEELLEAITSGIRRTLGFERARIERFEQDGRGRPVARLLAAQFEIEGCYLLTAAEASQIAPDVDLGQPSERSGQGPSAWRDHRLLVPLFATTGELLTVIHAGEPHDRLLPTREVLQALRIVADQAAAHLESASRLHELRYLADHDFLTGLGNRRAFVELLEAETARAARYKSRFTLALCDIDFFKELNDRFGHTAGDDALRRTARVLESGVRRSDRAFRIGGDEFALILIEASTEATRDVIDRIEDALHEPEREDAPRIRVSFGAISSDREDDPESLLRRADEAMYRVKRSRRGA